MPQSDTMIVMYNLVPEQDRAEFEQWLRDLDVPGYEKVSSMADPVYYHCEADLEGKAPPYKYVVAIRSTGGDNVDDEMTGPEWEGFVADFESRTRDAIYVTAERIIG